MVVEEWLRASASSETTTGLDDKRCWLDGADDDDDEETCFLEAALATVRGFSIGVADMDTDKHGCCCIGACLFNIRD